MKAAYENLDIGAVQSLSEFLETTGALTTDDMTLIVDQAIVLMEGFYTHLPLKRAMHAVDPVQRLKLLKRRIPDMSERSFHSEMIDIFVELRDLHTGYSLPFPYSNHTAVLPFSIEEYFDGDQPRYIVSKVNDGVNHETFVKGVEVTHWSGVPIEQAIANNADREAGSNEFARHVRGLDRMTIRPMKLSLPPDAEWVIVGYNDGTTDHEIRFHWQVTSPDPQPHVEDDESANANADTQLNLGVDEIGELTNRAKKFLFAKDEMTLEKTWLELNAKGELTPEAIAENMGNVSTLYDSLQYKTVNTPDGEFGYLRIRNFRPPTELFIPEIIKILELLPQSGMIIDVRGNGGGIIKNGERMLQLFTSNRVEAERFHFINTDLTLIAADTDAYNGIFKRWVPSIKSSLKTGEVYSQGLPMEDPEVINAIGRKYFGPAVLITDARCYSTTDIFAAGFQDNRIGKILGVDGNTGAGGANVLTHKTIGKLFTPAKTPIVPLPHNTKMRVSFRRTTRVGDQYGMPVEDLGIIPDRMHKMTKDDLLNGNVDLINAAAAILAEG